MGIPESKSIESGDGIRTSAPVAQIPGQFLCNQKVWNLRLLSLTEHLQSRGFISPEELVELLVINERTLYGWAREGKITRDKGDH
jgi:hypothetical protein